MSKALTQKTVSSRIEIGADDARSNEKSELQGLRNEWQRVSRRSKKWKVFQKKEVESPALYSMSWMWATSQYWQTEKWLLKKRVSFVGCQVCLQKTINNNRHNRRSKDSRTGGEWGRERKPDIGQQQECEKTKLQRCNGKLPKLLYFR